MANTTYNYNNDKDRELLSACVPLITGWYRQHKKPFPWRTDPTPYHVWISEIMLQQTRIEAALPYYSRFLEAFPTIEALAEAPDDRLMRLWQGLGYYSRARNLKKAAVLICETYGGRLPDRAAELKKLPGIGDYTAGAIASIAYGQPEPAVDGNVLRVVMRLLACSDDVLAGSTRNGVAGLLRQIYPSGQESAFLTEGLMELGEVICIPNGEAKCSDCPLCGLCRAYMEESCSRYPVRSAPKERKVEEKTVLLLICGNKVAIRRRGEEGLLAGLWEYPNTEGLLVPDELCALLDRQGIGYTAVAGCGDARHIFTHIEWRMHGYRVMCREETEGFVWKTPWEIEEGFAIPTAFRYFDRQMKKYLSGSAVGQG